MTVIGVGNPYRHDDGAGADVVARLRARLGESTRVRLLELDGEPVRLIQSWEGSDSVIVVDAVRSDAPPGTLHRVSAEELNRVTPRGVPLGGGHLLGIGEAVDLARALGQLPPHLEVIGIEGEAFDFGVGLCEAVVATCESLAAELAERIERRVGEG